MRKSSRVVSFSGSSRIRCWWTCFFGLVGMERRPEIAGSHAVETISLGPETLAQSHRRQ